MLFASARVLLAAAVVVTLGVAARWDDAEASLPSAPTEPLPTVDEDPTLEVVELSSTRLQVQSAS